MRLCRFNQWMTSPSLIHRGQRCRFCQELQGVAALCSFRTAKYNYDGSTELRRARGLRCPGTLNEAPTDPGRCAVCPLRRSGRRGKLRQLQPGLPPASKTKPRPPAFLRCALLLGANSKRRGSEHRMHSRRNEVKARYCATCMTWGGGVWCEMVHVPQLS